MMGMKTSVPKRGLAICSRPVMIIILMMIVVAVGFDVNAFSGLKDHDPKSLITVEDSKGKVISKLCHAVSVGDYIISQDNMGYTVTSVDKPKARVRCEGKVNLEKPSSEPRTTLGTAMSSLWEKLSSAVGQGRGKQTICIYHTHSDESYQPTSGTASEDKGDIYKIGAVLADALRKKGFEVVQSQTNHNPHDAAAYTRSRRTAAQLITQNRPLALIDVHRDAIPDASYYQTNVGGEEIAGSRIVVGKQNANRTLNLDFAKKIKAAADKKYPGLVKEIFWGRGNYNQDAGPKTILLEFGTHTNPEELARKGADLMADILPVAITGSERASGGGDGALTTGSGWRSLLIVLAVVVIIAVGFVALNRGGIEFFGKKGSGAGFLGRLPKDRKKRNRREKRQ